MSMYTNLYSHLIVKDSLFLVFSVKKYFIVTSINLKKKYKTAELVKMNN